MNEKAAEKLRHHILDALDRQDYGTAKTLLIKAQQLAEILYINEVDINIEHP